jgi:hypothetical protein
MYSNLSSCIQLVQAGIPLQIGLTSDPHNALLFFGVAWETRLLSNYTNHPTLSSHRLLWLRQFTPRDLPQVFCLVKT